MRKVDRKAVPVPKSLLPGEAGSKELAAVKLHRADTDPDKKKFEYKAYKRADVRMALETLFHGKCAYCETRYATSAPVDIEHYRPKGAVAEEATHGGYWWIAMDWENLLPSCIDCNRRREQELVVISASLADLAKETKPVKMNAGKKDSFPLAATGVRAEFDQLDFSDEGALLVDPCRDDPANHLGYSFNASHPAGLIIPVGEEPAAQRGAVSIQIYGLNRLKLVQERTRLLRQLEFLGDLVIDLAASIDDLEEPGAAAALATLPTVRVVPRLKLLRDRTIAEIKAATKDDAPYSSLARAWFENFKTRIANADGDPEA